MRIEFRRISISNPVEMLDGIIRSDSGAKTGQNVNKWFGKVLEKLEKSGEARRERRECSLIRCAAVRLCVRVASAEATKKKRRHFSNASARRVRRRSRRRILLSCQQNSNARAHRIGSPRTRTQTEKKETHTTPHRSERTSGRAPKGREKCRSAPLQRHVFNFKWGSRAHTVFSLPVSPCSCVRGRFFVRCLFALCLSASLRKIGRVFKNIRTHTAPASTAACSSVCRRQRHTKSRAKKE